MLRTMPHLTTLKITFDADQRGMDPKEIAFRQNVAQSLGDVTLPNLTALGLVGAYFTASALSRFLARNGGGLNELFFREVRAYGPKGWNWVNIHINFANCMANQGLDSFDIS
jgi:hypothetical protein